MPFAHQVESRSTGASRTTLVCEFKQARLTGSTHARLTERASKERFLPRWVATSRHQYSCEALVVSSAMPSATTAQQLQSNEDNDEV